MGHAIHPVLISFPLGLLSMAVIFDIIFLFTDRGGFPIAAAYMLIAGIISGLVAALFGLIDWLAIPKGTRARRIGVYHGWGNVLMLLPFAVSWLMRLDATGWRPNGVAITLGIVGAVLAAVTGWFGGELVERHGVSVHDNAGLDAPSSLNLPMSR